MSPARKTSSEGAPQASISSQVTGAETAGLPFARSVYGAAVVFAAAFWLKSTNTFPGRRARVIRYTARSGSAPWASTASAFAYAVTSSDGLGSSGTSRCRPLDPEVFPYADSPSAASRSRSQRATTQHSTMLAGGPGSRSNTSRSATAGVSCRH